MAYGSPPNVYEFLSSNTQDFIEVIMDSGKRHIREIPEL